MSKQIWQAVCVEDGFWEVQNERDTDVWQTIVAANYVVYDQDGNPIPASDVAARVAELLTRYGFEDVVVPDARLREKALTAALGRLFRKTVRN
jgi:hypothetical protein